MLLITVVYPAVNTATAIAFTTNFITYQWQQSIEYIAVINRHSIANGLESNDWLFSSRFLGILFVLNVSHSSSTGVFAVIFRLSGDLQPSFLVHISHLRTRFHRKRGVCVSGRV